MATVKQSLAVCESHMSFLLKSTNEFDFDLLLFLAFNPSTEQFATRKMTKVAFLAESATTAVRIFDSKLSFGTVGYCLGTSEITFSSSLETITLWPIHGSSSTSTAAYPQPSEPETCSMVIGTT